MRRRLAVLLLLALALTGCISQFRATCTQYGFLEGTPEHAYCTQRAVESRVAEDRPPSASVFPSLLGATAFAGSGLRALELLLQCGHELLGGARARQHVSRPPVKQDECREASDANALPIV
jgi:hypothetical protein